MLTHARDAANHHEAATTPESRKSKGQFFTPLVVAKYMANLFGPLPERFRLLDAGAGVGTLTAAFCERVMREKESRQFHADVFETDSCSIPRLRAVMKACETELRANGHEFSYSIIEDDFALQDTHSSSPLFGAEPGYDFAVMNPPYFKISAKSDYAKQALRLGASHPNIYSLFIASAIDRLKTDGELVAITPRSFCNGRYFRDFRHWLFQRASLEHVHSFTSRTDTFREANVLQESIISRFRKTTRSNPTVTISRSTGRNLSKAREQKLRRDQVVDNSCGDSLICIPEKSEDAAILEVTENWPCRFADTGLQISTGPVVMFRTRQFHVAKLNGAGTCPLFSSHHIRRSGLIWPKEKPKWPNGFLVSPESIKHLLPKKDYVLLKRFSAKEERRRLTASALFSASMPFNYFAVENHVNYISHRHRRLSQVELVGLVAVLNSAFMDRYFRCVSGNTQVNATEVRTMKFPTLEALSTIGQLVSADSCSMEFARERTVLEVLGVKGATLRYLEGLVGEEN